jgi:hypothetical protein
VPVVASENGNRPPGVRTYPAADPAALAALVLEVLERGTANAKKMPLAEIEDTLSIEAQLLTA